MRVWKIGLISTVLIVLTAAAAGKRGITPETAWLLYKAFDVSPQFWMNLQTNHDLSRTPRHAYVAFYLWLRREGIDALVLDLPTAFYLVAAEITHGTIVGQFPSTGAPEQFGMLFAKNNQLVGCVNEALSSIKSSGQLASFVLRKVQVLPYVEIAIALECTEEAARGRVSEALKKVKAAVA